MPAPTVSSGEDIMSLPYKNAKLPIDERVEDLLDRMTIQEKAGQMFHNMMIMGPGGSLLTEPNEAFGIASVETLLGEKLMTHFNLVGLVTDARETAEWQNRMQKRAQATRLGIPVTISTDPRNHFTDNIGTGFQAGVLSQWPETLGLPAIRSRELVERFANVARQEYLALGIRLALHPQIDLATEPRWARIGKTLERMLTSRRSSSQHTFEDFKHFPGGGPEKDGEDSHFTYGKEQVYPGGNMEYHIRPFRAAIAAGAAQMMPYYSMPVGTEFEEVGFGFNKGIITGLLREDLNFPGIICTDWGLVTDATILGQDMPARAWGVEHLSKLERVKKIIDAGCDQFGGESCPEFVVQLVEDGLVSESRINESVRRLLREKFVLGLFENPFVDVEAAASNVGNASFKDEGSKAQRRAFTLLTNKDNVLPLKGSRLKVYIEGIDPVIAASRLLEIVDTPSDADIALLRLKAPYEPRSGGFEARFNAGSLEYSNQEKARQAAIFKVVPTIVDIYLDRPAVIPEIAASAKALMASYGSSGDAFLDIVLGKASPEGKLPFDLPFSMKAVEESRSDMPYDTADPLFHFGHGLSYPIEPVDSVP
ncbi:Glycoside hydrolase, superfamily [Penicillium expansum]|uniref:beta-glucosidase n=1 Tax=Penicillium expansum TaxID=27334 RepID=A0A0A2K0N2_PENEN|nr:Glycoside hydrolase, superfamily [Penicillium expansum]KGO39841.1 Glycoside hydrolase, superfamily [Penicillium expansum]KGO61224.1 Glycoside hydrolase, superfamily [Penicillium expansum]